MELGPVDGVRGEEGGDEGGVCVDEHADGVDAGREGGAYPDAVAIVSSEYHLLRAKMQAKKLGVRDCAGVAAKTTLPVLRMNYFMREAFGVARERYLG